MEKTWEHSTLMKLFVSSILAVWLNIQPVESANKAVSYFYPSPNKIEI